MPWTGKSFAMKHNKALSGAAATKAAKQANAILKSTSFAMKHNKALSGAAATKAAKQANAILKSTGDEGLAIATANKQAAKHKAAPGGKRGR